MSENDQGNLGIATTAGIEGGRVAPRILEEGEAIEAAPGLVGKVLSGLYKVTSQIGEGGMGTVYRADHIHLNKPFAIKVLTESAAANKAAVERLLQEAQLASSIDHDNIVDVINFDTTQDGRVFLVMEFLTGDSLSDIVEGGQMPLERALPLAVQICQALEAAHQGGIVHRDLKPDNIFVVKKRGADFVKVLDFGISKVKTAEAEQVRMTKTGQLVGTPLYMSPEQARGEADIDSRADIYALGVILYEMLVGSPPFEGGNYFQLLWKHGNEVPPVPMEQRTEIPQALSDLILRMLAKERGDRPASMLEVEQALFAVAPEWIDGHARAASLAPESSRTTSNPSGVVPLGSSPELAARHSEPVSLPAAGGGSMKWLAAIVLVALVGAGVFWAASGGDAPEEVVEPEAIPTPPIEVGTQENEETRSGESGEQTANEGEEAELPIAEVPPAPIAVEISSSPPGATVLLGEEELGTTPLTEMLPPEQEVQLRFRLRGHRARTVTLNPSESSSVEVTLRPRERNAGPSAFMLKMSL